MKTHFHMKDCAHTLLCTTQRFTSEGEVLRDELNNGVLRDEPNNGCVGDYCAPGLVMKTRLKAVG